MERCALAKYEREVDIAEKEHEYDFECMTKELDEAIEMIKAIHKKYDMRSEAIEYIKDTL